VSRYRLGIDIGGTFTDLHAMDESSGELFALKIPSTRADPSDAVIAGIDALRARFGIEPSDIRYFAHGTTLGVNTLLERNGAEGGALMTEGFTDTLELRRLRLPKANDFFVAKPRALVPRRRVKPIRERLLANGNVLTPIERDDVLARVRELLEDGIETLAVSFLHAHRNPRHERLAKGWIEEEFPELYVCASSEIWPQQREYERSLISVINAYVGNRLRSYFRALESRLTDIGMTCRVFSTKSNGGVMSVASAAASPVETLLSGPASGVIGAAYVGKLMGDSRLVTLDMGGTSVDVSIVYDGLRYSSENTIGDFPVIMPAVDVSAVGAGGGSIAWTDAEGVLKVGPESAGADPGPACYGRGGTRPTVTDAYLCAGIIAPDKFLGGEMTLHASAAEQVIDEIGTKLELDRKQSADAILQVTTANIFAELLPQLARRGVDSRELSIMAYGAAGPTHVFMLARDLNVRRVIVPPSPGILCALGCLVADVRADFVQSIWRTAEDMGDDELEGIFADLDEQARTWLESQAVELDQVHVLRSADMCYVGQSYEVNVAFPDIELQSLKSEHVVEWFHKQYARVYGRADSDSPTRILEARVQIAGVTPKPEVRLVHDVDHNEARHSTAREVYENGKSRQASVWSRGDLRPGEVYEGPLIIEQYDTTVYVPEEFSVTVDERFNLIGERQA
jgi:N-methylhydantoinase A